jgi:nitrite reductase/ring-hydroxylating ferredoxin subunit
MEPRFIAPEELRARLQGLSRSMRVTSGHYENRERNLVGDLEWNHMDQAHRPHVHNTYTEAVRISLTPKSAVSLNIVRLLGFPVFVLVTDQHLGPGLFYQCYSLFGVLYVHSVEHFQPEIIEVDWHIVSHWAFRWLHPWLNSRIKRLNVVQTDEDEVIRRRREELRKRGYRFKSDPPDFLSANSMASSTIPPRPTETRRVDTRALRTGEIEKIPLGTVEILVRRQPDGTLQLWPEACPHEGGSLASGKVCGENELRCPWHGLKFAGARLGAGYAQTVRLGGASARLEGDELVLGPEGGAP